MLPPTPTPTLIVRVSHWNESSQSVLFLRTLFSRASRFGIKSLATTFVSSEGDQQVMDAIQARFEVAMTEFPDFIDPANCSESLSRPSLLQVLNMLDRV